MISGSSSLNYYLTKEVDNLSLEDIWKKFLSLEEKDMVLSSSGSRIQIYGDLGQSVGFRVHITPDDVYLIDVMTPKEYLRHYFARENVPGFSVNSTEHPMLDNILKGAALVRGIQFYAAIAMIQTIELNDTIISYYKFKPLLKGEFLSENTTSPIVSIKKDYEVIEFHTSYDPFSDNDGGSEGRIVEFINSFPKIRKNSVGALLYHVIHPDTEKLDIENVNHYELYKPYLDNLSNYPIAVQIRIRESIE